MISECRFLIDELRDRIGSLQDADFRTLNVDSGFVYDE